MTAHSPMYENSPEKHSNLRHSADAELDKGSLDINSGWVLPPETLGLLYTMASEPENASGALKLLHELQTHQVELELQYRQLVSNEQFIKEQLSKFKTMLEVAAIGYIVADAGGKITEINSAASALLNIEDENMIGKSVHQFFQPLAQSRLHNLFKQLAENNETAEVVCIEKPANNMQPARQLKITASSSVAGNAVLMIIVEDLLSKTN